MERPFVSIVVAGLFVVLFALSARAEAPVAGVPTWKISELPTAIFVAPHVITDGTYDASFLPLAGDVLHTSTEGPRWYRLTLDADWTSDELPVLSLSDAGFTRVSLYAPPNYAEQARWSTMGDSNARFSRHALAFLLSVPPRANQSLYLHLDRTLTDKHPRVSLTDLASYQANDLLHVRATTLFTSVQFAMILVGFCLWLALRDRVYAYFVAYSGLQLVYLLLASGEFYDLPFGELATLLGQKATWVFAVLSAPLSITFILEFCDLRRIMPRLANLLAATRWPYVLALVLLLLPIPLAVKDTLLPSLVNLMFLIGSVIAIGTVGYAALRGNRSSVFFLVAWMPQVLFTGFRVLQIMLGYTQPAWLEYGFPFTTAFSSIVVVLGLADATLHARRERDHAQGLADSDGLTGVLNHRALITLLAKEFAEARAHSLPLALLFLDLDHFKAINDRHGHMAGDVCLKAIAEAIAVEVHDGQHFGRYGGEEFLIILPGSRHAEALAIGERLRRRVESLRIDADDQTLRLTASIGVANMLESHDSPERLLERADAALYGAKAAGRNRVIIHQAPALADA